MPYKDPEQKRLWEWQHRSQRLTRRRELRRLEAARKEAQSEVPNARDSGAGLLLPLVAGGTLAAHNPKLVMGAGGLTLVVAALYKKGWSWWIVGVLILVLGLFFQWNNKNEQK
jgi:hypothetical protein